MNSIDELLVAEATKVDFKLALEEKKPCAVNRNGQSVLKIGKLGKVSQECLDKVFDKRFTDKSVLCIDKEKSYCKFSSEHNLELIQLAIGKPKKGIYHIQHINNYHSRLKEFIRPFKGGCDQIFK